MRTVDLSTLPDHAEHRAELSRALDAVDLGDARRTDPIDIAAAFGLGYPQELGDDELRTRAMKLRDQLLAHMPKDATVQFRLADAEAGHQAGAPTRLA